MSFFDNTKSLGIIFEFVGILMLVYAAMLFVSTFTDWLGVPDLLPNQKESLLVIGVGEVIAAIVYILFADRVMRGVLSDKLHVLSSYMLIVACTTFIIITSDAIGEYILGLDTISLITLVVGTLICLIIAAIALSVRNGKKGIRKKFIWAILVVVFAIMLIFNLLPADNMMDFIDHIAHTLIAVFMLLFLMEAEVKIGMGAA